MTKKAIEVYNAGKVGVIPRAMLEPYKDKARDELGLEVGQITGMDGRRAVEFINRYEIGTCVSWTSEQVEEALESLLVEWYNTHPEKVEPTQTSNVGPVTGGLVVWAAADATGVTMTLTQAQTIFRVVSNFMRTP
jgi:hypothetical protein